MCSIFIFIFIYMKKIKEVEISSRMTPNLHSRFNKAFNTSAVSLVTIKDTHFVMVNSMAMERDGCNICTFAMKKLASINGTTLIKYLQEKIKKYSSTVFFINCFHTGTFSCMKDDDKCSGYDKSTLKQYSRPILLQVEKEKNYQSLFHV